MLTQKTIFELISATGRVFSGVSKAEVKEKLEDKIKNLKRQIEYRYETVGRYERETCIQQKELDEDIQSLAIYESEMNKYLRE